MFVWEAKQDVATVEELDQYYVLCPYDIKDGYLVETVRLYREKSPTGSIVIFTDTCRCVLSYVFNVLCVSQKIDIDFTSAAMKFSAD